jgi:hypothetical protein
MVPAGSADDHCFGTVLAEKDADRITPEKLFRRVFQRRRMMIILITVYAG